MGLTDTISLNIETIFEETLFFTRNTAFHTAQWRWALLCFWRQYFRLAIYFKLCTSNCVIPVLLFFKNSSGMFVVLLTPVLRGHYVSQIRDKEGFRKSKRSYNSPGHT